MADLIPDTSHISQATILHIEDDPASRYAIGRVLHHEGFTVREAATGAEGLRLVKERPDLVILDVQLPDLNGFEVCRRIKADPATAMIPVLHLSASYVTDKDQVTGLEGGADGYLVQPVDPGVLVATVRALLRMRRAEEELRESSRRIEHILESTTDAFFALDREWRFTYINQRGLRQMQRSKGEQLTREELLGKNAWELYPELVGSVFYDKYHEALREQKSVEFEAYSEPSDQWYEVHVYPSEEGLALYRRDITERKRAEDQLREANRRTEAILESISDTFLALDREWRFTYINEPGLRSIQAVKGDEELTREGVLGMNAWEVFPEYVGSVFDQKFHEAMREQKSVEFEAYSTFTDRWVEVHAYPSEEGLSVYYQDISERKRDEEQLTDLCVEA